MERPHDRLGGRIPATHYARPLRPYPNQLPLMGTPGHFLVKKITNVGTFRFRHRPLFVAQFLLNHHIGSAETEDGLCSIYFNITLLAKFDTQDYMIQG